jgi:hypothetical protein
MQFVDIWSLINNVHLQDDTEDNIIWMFMNNGHYSVAWAYKMQFLGLVHQAWTLSFGRIGRRQYQRTTRGSYSKVGFGRQIN